MQELKFEVQGSASEPYDIEIKKRGDNNLSTYCSCPAGMNGKHCKHRIGILTGKPVGVVGDRNADLATAAEWGASSDIGEALVELVEAEKKLTALKSHVSKLKKTVAKAMLD